jgi:nitroreductase
MASSISFADAVKSRRSYYQLNKKAPISDDKIERLVKDAVLHAPSSFNSQSSRLVVLLKDEHDKFWEFVKEVLKPQVPAEQFEGTVQKLDGFKAGYGTVSCPSGFCYNENESTNAMVNRSYSSRTQSQSRSCRKLLRSMQTNSQCGLSTRPQSTSTFCGQVLRQKALELIFNM